MSPCLLVPISIKISFMIAVSLKTPATFRYGLLALFRPPYRPAIKNITCLRNGLVTRAMEETGKVSTGFLYSLKVVYLAAYLEEVA